MFRLTIVTPEEIILDGEVSSVIVPGSEGYLGVLTDHAPLITALKPGKLTIRDANDTESIMAVTFGFFEVSGNRATLLVDAAEAVEKIDLERARKALERAKERLKSRKPEIDLERATRAMERAKNRIEIVESRPE